MPKGRAESFSDCVIAFPPTSVDSAIFARRGTQGHSPKATNIYRSIRARFLEMGEYGFFFVVGEHDEGAARVCPSVGPANLQALMTRFE
jgi:hypothetical protein